LFLILFHFFLTFNFILSSIEPLQLIKYESGQYYKVHHDHGAYYNLPDANRDMTLLLFLSSMSGFDQGGQTCFPLLDIQVLPTTGDAIVWMNVHENTQQSGRPNQAALHEGMPPVNIDTIKYACNVWIREAAPSTDSKIKTEAYNT